MIEIKSLGIVGAGQMGGGIAQVAADKGVNVILLDATQELADKGRHKIDQSLQKLVEKGRHFSEEEKRARTGIPYSAAEIDPLQEEAARAGVAKLDVSAMPFDS